MDKQKEYIYSDKKFVFYTIPIFIGFVLNFLLIKNNIYLIIILIGLFICHKIFSKNMINSLIFILILIGINISFKLNNINNINSNILSPISSYSEFEIKKKILTCNGYYVYFAKAYIDSPQLGKIQDVNILLKIADSCYYMPGNKLKGRLDITLPSKNKYPFQFDEEIYCKLNNIQLIASANSQFLSIFDNSVNLEYYRSVICEKIYTILNDNISVEFSPIVYALISGDKSKIDIGTRLIFSHTGTSHVLAVSGLHVALIAVFLNLLLIYIKNRKFKFILFTLSIISYIFLTGFQASAVRAGIMIIIYYYVKINERRINILNLLFLTGFIIVIADPITIYDPGFQMSFVSVIGIVLFYIPIKLKFQRVNPSKNYIIDELISSISITLAASLIVSPIVAYYFGIYSLISPLTNLFVIPLTSFGMIYGSLGLFASFISDLLARPFFAVSEILIRFSIEINKIWERAPAAYLETSILIFSASVLSFLMLYLFLSTIKSQFVFRFISSILIFILFISIGIQWENRHQFSIFSNQKIVCISDLNASYNLIYISDRKPKAINLPDNRIINYLKTLSGNTIIAIDGNTGSSIADEFKNNSNYKLVYCSHQIQDSIKTFFNLKCPIPQIIKSGVYDY
ncbi:MAG: ComEC/Rec2 family competence protein [Candidatus Kapabacteria bacterium]|nr:ComEC/Rec2 family competence protein [Candidatus Kapabacteria bacterium]